jgi:NADP-dependent 3-hydroxy acid dehydrogenase YdfG
MKLNGKVTWVIGASSGIGAAVARELVCRGATVAISARRDDRLREVSGGDMLVVPLDVTDAASVAAAAARVNEELGPIDLAVLSAGYWKQMDLTDWDIEVFDQHIRTNLTGMSNSIAAVLPGMLRQHHGVIAGIASVAGYRGLAGAEAYGATKAAQINLLESLRVHVARTGAGHYHLPRLRADRPHGRQLLPHAVPHRGRPGRTVHLRRTRARAHRDRLPHADGPADEGRPRHPRPSLDGHVGSHLNLRTPRLPRRSPIHDQENLRMP